MNSHSRLYLLFKILTFLLFLIYCCSLDVMPVSAVSVVVNTFSDDEDVDDSYCSLREAITAIISNDGDYYGCFGGNVSSYITLPEGVYTVEDQLPWFGMPITINGAGAELTTIQASSCNPTVDTCTNDYELFWISSAGHLTLSNLTVRNGQNIGDVNGGAIYNAGTLDVTNCVITANRGAQGGVILNNGGTISILNSTFSDNMVKISDYWDGGAIFNATSGTVTIDRSTFAGNYGRFGGAIRNNGTLTILNSTFSGNYGSVNGGALYNYGSATITNSTFAENASEFGGAAIHNYSAGTLLITNAIIANSSVGETGFECVNEGSLSTSEYYLVEDGSCDADITGDPLLGPLADNGGPTQTYALLTGSNAIDQGKLAACLATDQRGVSRPQGAGCDIGAYEKEPFYFTFIPLMMK